MDVERLIFELYKDKAIKSRKELERLCFKKYGDLNYRDIYVNIYNYQLKKYGTKLNDMCYVEGIDWVKVNVNSRARRYQREKRGL